MLLLDAGVSVEHARGAEPTAAQFPFASDVAAAAAARTAAAAAAAAAVAAAAAAAAATAATAGGEEPDAAGQSLGHLTRGW